MLPLGLMRSVSVSIGRDAIFKCELIYYIYLSRDCLCLYLLYKKICFSAFNNNLSELMLNLVNAMFGTQTTSAQKVLCYGCSCCDVSWVRISLAVGHWALYSIMPSSYICTCITLSASLSVYYTQRVFSDIAGVACMFQRHRAHSRRSRTTAKCARASLVLLLLAGFCDGRCWCWRCWPRCF